ncbi:MAG: hypothetical protein WBY94_26810 [Polyangiaceae bacterium]
MPLSGAAVCDSQTCPAGCCDSLGDCQPGSLNTACGNSGNACQECESAGGEQCVFQQCEIGNDAGTCSAQTCAAGCCDSSRQCQQGVTSLACGALGVNCQNCLGNFEQCSANQQCVPLTGDAGPSCPAMVPGCPPSLQERAPAPRTACSAWDLETAAQDCAAGASASSASCDSFFGCSNTACAACLKPFDFDFPAQTGIRTCVAPFVDAACNHNSACIDDCTAESCFLCTSDALSSCETQVQTGECAAFTQADECVAQALAGAAAFCSPAAYQGNFGAWLKGVGAKYCGP